ncbi:myb-like protein X isoform X2 [Acyrthosiphon pisum]|uniref:Uncharacterized protein n=1 Tax=Acyrthosiphon pisum TaxID=7029 RepID=A0A8R2FC40_ACYPI|nr:myb-like protein X isoform X2 [Acyrthosiphon pisum]|eukprot:XP_008187910.1 PREDICTED: myb-like protein X isoform X1 [Acyrthosiphon pisum]
MNVLKTTKMNSKILVIVLLAYFLDNLSAATLKPVKSTSLNGKNTPATLVISQPIKSHLLPPSRASAPTTEPTNENDDHQGFDSVEEDDYYEEEEEEEGGGDEEHLENSKTVKIPTQSKPTISTKVNNSSNKFQTSQSKLSSSTSTKPITPESVKQKNGNQQGFETLEGDDDEEEVEEEIEDEDQEELLENSKTVTSQPKLSTSISTKPITPESVKQESDNHQGFETLEGDDYEEEEVEEEIDDEDYEEPLGNSKTVTSQPVLSYSTSRPKVPEYVNQENDNHQGFETLEGDDYEEVSEENEDGHNVEEYSEDSDHNTPTDYTTINGVQVNLPVPMNNPTVPQLSEDELTENNYSESEYSLNTDEDHSLFQNDDGWEPKSFNINNNPTEISETLDRKNDNTKDQLINTNEFESNPYDNTQIFTDKQEENSEYRFKNQYVLENKERIINGYEALKKILYMLHDYASSTFNWIINKINYRIEQVSS